MKQCPKCQAVLPDNARFCMNCGGDIPVPPQPTAQRLAAGSLPSAMIRPDSSRRKWALIGAVALVIAAVGIMLGASGLLRSQGREPDGKLLQAKGAEQPAGLLEAKGNPSSGVTQVAGPEPRVPAVMPADVRAWLEHLERIEKQRVELTQDQLGELMVRMVAVKMGGAMEALKSLTSDDPGEPIRPPNEDFSAEIREIRAAWTKLGDMFNSVQPPEECVPIRRSYDQALRETGGMIADVLDVIGGSDENPQEAVSKLIKMQGTSAKRIDEAAKATDKQVGEICSKYETRKWFDISGDIGGGGMFSKLGGF